MILRPSSVNAVGKPVGLLRPGISPAVIRANANSDLVSFVLHSQALTTIKATDKLSRREYLQKEILDRYIATQPEIQASGTDRK